MRRVDREEAPRRKYGKLVPGSTAGQTGAGNITEARENVNSDLGDVRSVDVDSPSLMPWDASDDPKPKWTAMFNILLNRHRQPVLGDSGCTCSCISYEYFAKNPYLKKSFKPIRSSGVAINGSDVPSVGEVTLKFRLGNTPMSITCKIIKGLMVG